MPRLQVGIDIFSDTPSMIVRCMECDRRRVVKLDDLKKHGLRIPGIREFPRSGPPEDEMPELVAFVHAEEAT